MTLETRSIPFSTPAKMMSRVMAVKIKKQSSEEKPLAMKEEKYPSAAIR